MPELDLEKPYRQGDPLDMEDARTAAREVARLRRKAEAALTGAVKAAAEAEAAYRKALSVAMVKAKAENPEKTADAIARADATKELIAFRVAEGMVKAAEQRIKGIEGERSLLKSLIDWSATIANVMRASGGMRNEPERRPS